MIRRAARWWALIFAIIFLPAAPLLAGVLFGLAVLPRRRHACPEAEQPLHIGALYRPKSVYSEPYLFPDVLVDAAGEAWGHVGHGSYSRLDSYGRRHVLPHQLLHETWGARPA